MEGTPRPEPGAPQLRTLLLTDLCDSTQLVERLGDGMAAALFREHDRLVLELQQRWRGRLIDRSDGLLLVFERPLDGLGFALDYRQGLEALGRAHATGPLLARIGLHVGEVLMWQNSDEAVSAGAKSVEVEGLAKPFAARLMHLARPGQILLSAVAEPLVRRAARELGGRGHALQWRSHGRWRFKGVPEVQEVHEVGEPGLAPLRMPKGDAKAHRDIPLWRRPMALAAEVALVAGVAIGVWFITRPEPAIAFSERDWVVVADVRNLTGQAVLDDSLEQAFRISLEQSRYVNVIGDLKVRETLRRMELDPRSSIVDREIGAELAQRSGARLLVLPTVAEVGGRIRVTAEAIDPYSGKTLLSESADGKGIETALDSIDRVTRRLRDALGEGLDAVRRDSLPLPDVTTSSLDALRAFALAEKAYASSRFDEAQALFAQAIGIDAEFALAHLGLARTLAVLGDPKQAESSLAHAMGLRSRLPARDQLYLEAWHAEIHEPQRALHKWQLMTKLYPDFFFAFENVGYALRLRNRYEEALPYAKAATSEQGGVSGTSWNLVGLLSLALEDFPGAEAAFVQARNYGSDRADLFLALVHAAKRDKDAAQRLLQESRAKVDYAWVERVSVLLDSGSWSAAAAEAAVIYRSQTPDGSRQRASRFPLAVSLWALGNGPDSLAHLRSLTRESLQVLQRREEPRMARLEASYVASAAAMLAVRMGDINPARQASRVLEENRQVFEGTPVEAMLVGLQAAVRWVKDGQPGDAVQKLAAYMDGTEPLQLRALLVDMQVAAGQLDDALVNAQWILDHRGRAYAEQGCGYCQQPLNVYESNLASLRVAEIQWKLGRCDMAEDELRRFDAAWGPDVLPDHLRKRRTALSGMLSRIGDIPMASESCSSRASRDLTMTSLGAMRPTFRHLHI